MDQHHLEKIKHKKHFFVKSFVISLVLLIILCLIATFGFDFMAQMSEKLYGLDTEDYAKVFVTAFAIWKILIIQFTLVPEIAMHMIEKHVKEKIKKGIE